VVKYILLKIAINFKGLAIKQPKITFIFSKGYTALLKRRRFTSTQSITELRKRCGLLVIFQVLVTKTSGKRRNKTVILILIGLITLVYF